MTLRARLSVLTAMAVAVTIVVAAIALWALIRGALVDEVDERMAEQVPEAEQLVERRVVTNGDDGQSVVDRGRAVGRLVLDGEPIGVQVLDPDGEVTGQVEPDVEIPLDHDEEGLLAGETSDPAVRTVTVDGVPYRVMTATISGGGVVRLVQSLESVESTMGRIAWLLVAVAGVGVAGAAGLGWATARAGLRPVDRLVDAAEEVTTTRDLSRRIDLGIGRRDEVARLAGSINGMLSALEEARTQQRELVENAGHELRTPLATLRNDLGLLLRAEQHPDRSLPAEERTQLLRDLETEAATLSELVAETIDLARGETEPEPPVEADLGVLIDRSVQRSRRVDPRVEVTVDASTSEAQVRPAALERAISNLVRNAIQVSGDGAVVEVRAAEADGWVTVQVLDRGPGISEQDLPRVFDRFYRGAAARQRHGSGLGLAIASQVADLHGGTVDVSNRHGGGAVFTLRVPTRIAETAPPAPS